VTSSTHSSDCAASETNRDRCVGSDSPPCGTSLDSSLNSTARQAGPCLQLGAGVLWPCRTVNITRITIVRYLQSGIFEKFAARLAFSRLQLQRFTGTPAFIPNARIIGGICVNLSFTTVALTHSHPRANLQRAVEGSGGRADFSFPIRRISIAAQTTRGLASSYHSPHAVHRLLR
jgi:hypothetical protein